MLILSPSVSYKKIFLFGFYGETGATWPQEVLTFRMSAPVSTVSARATLKAIRSAAASFECNGMLITSLSGND